MSALGWVALALALIAVIGLFNTIVWIMLLTLLPQKRKEPK
jgi:hypothetical protein